jgi:hypothetical protein
MLLDRNRILVGSVKQIEDGPNWRFWRFGFGAIIWILMIGGMFLGSLGWDKFARYRSEVEEIVFIIIMGILGLGLMLIGFHGLMYLGFLLDGQSRLRLGE